MKLIVPPAPLVGNCTARSRHENPEVETTLDPELPCAAEPILKADMQADDQVYLRSTGSSNMNNVIACQQELKLRLEI